jgi:hypothetical protein
MSAHLVSLVGSRLTLSSNWNLDKNGRNTTNSPDETWKFWWQLSWPVWKDFNTYGGKGNHPMHPAWKYAGGALSLGLLGQVFVLQKFGVLQPVVDSIRHLGLALTT